jgi:hypothetical protein
MIGAKGHLIRSIAQECGGVIIRFPHQGSTANTVTIRGPKNDVENAKKQLQELANEKVSSEELHHAGLFKENIKVSSLDWVTQTPIRFKC